MTASDQALFAAASEDRRGTAVTRDELVELGDLREELLLRQLFQSGPSAAGPRGVALALHGYGAPPRPSRYALGPGGADNMFRVLSYDGELHDAALKAAGVTNKFVIEEARMALSTAFYLQPVVEAQKALLEGWLPPHRRGHPTHLGGVGGVHLGARRSSRFPRRASGQAGDC